VVSAQFEALLLAPILSPSFGGDASPLGGYGAIVLAQRIAQQDASGFARLLAATFEGRDGDGR
jgi:hypothetical protein